MLFVFVLMFCVINIHDVKTDGEKCDKDGVIGVCTELSKCLSAKQEIREKKIPKVCEFVGIHPVVCCFDDPIPGPSIIITTTQGPISTPQFVPSGDDDNNKYDAALNDFQCDPIPTSLTANKTGRKAWDKCIEYQQLVYPCQKGTGLGAKGRDNRCHHGTSEALFGERHANMHEFTHTALLGFGANLTSLDWLCGGALISDRYVLTAAHCTYSIQKGEPTYIALHPRNRAAIDPQVMYRIRSIIKHPEFKAPKTYHDIALLELEAPVPLDSYTVPACLNTGDGVTNVEIVTATSWNTNDILKTKDTQLQKIQLTRFSSEECSKIYPHRRKGGFNDTLQYCYGDKSGAKDICQDDGGNPIIINNRKLSCMYTILGVTSYGKGCFNHNPGVYTKVEPYVTWIESVVWP